MTLVVVLFVLSLAAAYFLWRYQWQKTINDSLEYVLEFSTDEIAKGEYFYLRQTIKNTSNNDIPFLKISTLLPEGLSSVLGPISKKSQKDDTAHSTEGICMLKANSEIMRKWRVVAEKRGVYSAQQVKMHIVASDVWGDGILSKKLEPKVEANDVITVLPVAEEWLTDIAPGPLFAGERAKETGFIKDYMLFSGIRKYEYGDSFNNINWKQSAKLGQTMVNTFYAVENDTYNIILNVQSMIIEPEPTEISVPQHAEACISICASLLNSALQRNLPVKLIANAFPTNCDGEKPKDNAIGSKIFCSDDYNRSSSIVDVYRILARLEMKISVPVERMVDDIVANPQYYFRGGNIVFVTSFIDQRMINFYYAMKQQGLNVYFFVLASKQNPVNVPDEIKAHFKHIQLKGGVGYGF